MIGIIDCKVFGICIFLIFKVMKFVKNLVMILFKNFVFVLLLYNVLFVVNIFLINLGISFGWFVMFCVINVDKIGIINFIVIFLILFIVV